MRIPLDRQSLLLQVVVNPLWMLDSLRWGRKSGVMTRSSASKPNQWSRVHHDSPFVSFDSALIPRKPPERLKKGEISPWLSTPELQDVCGDEYLI